MTTEEIKKLATEAAAFLATIPALVPYTAPIALGMAVAAAVAPPIYEEIKFLLLKSHEGEKISEEEVAALLGLIAALKTPANYFDDGVASVTPPAPASLNFIR